ncbi:hypothetical protein, partial [Leptospira borgpetersenii]|uniref:hypothetical protein n=1 Tax=Leptospira borgpetersenii TaxID=174 RepID=UPI0027DB938C
QYSFFVCAWKIVVDVRLLDFVLGFAVVNPFFRGGIWCSRLVSYSTVAFSHSLGFFWGNVELDFGVLSFFVEVLTGGKKFLNIFLVGEIKKKK